MVKPRLEVCLKHIPAGKELWKLERETWSRYISSYSWYCGEAHSTRICEACARKNGVEW